MSDEGDFHKYGRPYSHERSAGPLWRKRSCTDIPCLIIFVLFLGGWAYIANYAIQNGDLNRFVMPTDSFNQKCGSDSNVLNKKYLFFFDFFKCIDPLTPITGCPTPQICVESCPTQSFIWDIAKRELSFNELKSRLICLTDDDKIKIQTVDDAEKAINEDRCARNYMDSSEIFNRCVGLPQKACTFSSALTRRVRRDINEIPQNITSNINNEIKMEPMAFSLTSNLEKRVAGPANSKLEIPVEKKIQCSLTKDLTLIKEKMLKTDSRLSKLVGSFVAHFSKDVHDAQEIGEAIVEDIVNSWSIVLIALFCTLIASLVFIALMRWLAAPLVWLSILGVLGGLIFGTYLSVRQYQYWKNIPTVPNHSLNLNSAVKNILQESSTWLYLSIFGSVCFIVIFLLVIVLRTRISIAIALTKEGSKAVTSVTSTVFFPIFSWILFIGAIAYAIGVGLYLGSIGTSTFRMVQRLDQNSLLGVSNENCICEAPVAHYKIGDSCDPTLFHKHCYVVGSNSRVTCSKTSCSFNNIQHSSMVSCFIAYNVFGYLWLTFFIAAFNDMVLAGAFAIWYWTFKKKDVPYFTLTKAFCQTLFYHLGTLAFGSLILAICRAIRLILEYINSKLKKYDNAVTRAILCCMRCFFWLLEAFLKFLNKNAYIMCAIHGKSFCFSAKDAFNLVMRNFLRVIALDQVTDFLFFLSKVLLAGAAGVATYYAVSTRQIVSLHYAAVPTTIVVIGSFLITSVFFGVYSMAVDTLFLCFLEDCERNDGSLEKPYYMSKQLMSILGKRNKRPKRSSSGDNKK